MHIKTNDVNEVTIPSPYRRTVKILSSPDIIDATTTRFTMGISIIPAGGKTESHAHEGTEECMYVLSGQGECEVAGRKFKIEQNDLILAKPGQNHQFFNNIKKPLKLLWVYAPPGAEKKLLEAARKDPKG
jgi:mannose-6-phosphate isomerase-like protein (cupin superfamily)